MENFYYYGKHKKKQSPDTFVLQKSVLQKNTPLTNGQKYPTLQVRIDEAMRNDL